MSEITLSTSVADLVAAGLIASPEALVRLLKRPKSGRQMSETDQAEHEMLCEKILETIDSAQSGARWKTGVLNQVIFGMIKGISDETERKTSHGRISKALKELASNGLIEKPYVSNAAHSYYLKVEGQKALPLHEREEAQVETEVEVEVEVQVIETPKPKARVRKSKKSKK